MYQGLLQTTRITGAQQALVTLSSQQIAFLFIMLQVDDVFFT
jgi:hypothetical protein